MTPAEKRRAAQILRLLADTQMVTTRRDLLDLASKLEAEAGEQPFRECLGCSQPTTCERKQQCMIKRPGEQVPREPTEAMMIAAGEAWGYSTVDQDIRAMWTAMYDASRRGR
jgi:hypothetical protein